MNASPAPPHYASRDRSAVISPPKGRLPPPHRRASPRNENTPRNETQRPPPKQRAVLPQETRPPQPPPKKKKARRVSSASSSDASFSSVAPYSFSMDITPPVAGATEEAGGTTMTTDESHSTNFLCATVPHHQPNATEGEKLFAVETGVWSMVKRAKDGERADGEGTAPTQKNAKLPTAATMPSSARFNLSFDSDELYTDRTRDAMTEQRDSMERHRLTQTGATWLILCTVVKYFQQINRQKQIAARKKTALSRLHPRLVLWGRRIVRRARNRIASRTLERPSVTDIRHDRMLGLFSEAHIQYLVDNLKPRFYFPNETIIFMGCEDDECYVLSSGSADVLMGKVKVFTMTAGMVFGSVGMISGEPRTATIVAREPCYVWYIARKVFESYGARDHQVAAAQTIIRELRQKNIGSVYKGLIDAEYVQGKFAGMRGCSTEAVAYLLAKGEPRVLKHGEVLVAPPSQGEEGGSALMSAEEQAAREQGVGLESVYFVLRGKVRILRASDAPIPTDKVLEEHLNFLCDLATRRLPGEEVDVIQKAVEEYERSLRIAQNQIHLSGGDQQANRRGPGRREVVAELSGPMLINLAPMLLQEPSPLVVETLGGCDVLVLSSEMFSRQKDTDQQRLAQNALNIHCPFMKPLSRTPLLRLLFQSNLSFDFLSRVVTEKIVQDPYVYSPGSVLNFSPEDGFVAYIVLRGTLQCDLSYMRVQRAECEARLWPDIHLTIFGCESCRAVTTSRLEALRIRRCDILEALLRVLDEHQLETFISALTTMFVSRIGRRPTLDPTFDRHAKPSVQARWKFLQSKSKELSRCSQPVHVMHDVSYHNRSSSNSSAGGGGGGGRHTTGAQQPPIQAPSLLHDGEGGGGGGPLEDHDGGTYASPTSSRYQTDDEEFLTRSRREEPFVVTKADRDFLIAVTSPSSTSPTAPAGVGEHYDYGGTRSAPAVSFATDPSVVPIPPFYGNATSPRARPSSGGPSRRPTSAVRSEDRREISSAPEPSPVGGSGTRSREGSYLSRRVERTVSPPTERSSSYVRQPHRPTSAHITRGGADASPLVSPRQSLYPSSSRESSSASLRKSHHLPQNRPTAQRLHTGVIPVKYSAPTRGVSKVQQLHQQLEEFFEGKQ